MKTPDFRPHDSDLRSTVGFGVEEANISNISVCSIASHVLPATGSVAGVGVSPAGGGGGDAPGVGVCCGLL